MAQTPVVLPGSPCWAELTTPDLDEAIAFYGDLFGWRAEAQQVRGSDESRCFMHLDGRLVCSIASRDDGSPRWTPAFATADADESGRRVTEHGGAVISGPVEVGGACRMVMFADPTGASFVVWQAITSSGAEVVNHPGAVSYRQLVTDEMDTATSFYAAVFGWSATPTGGLHDRTNLSLGDVSIGAMRRPETYLPMDQVAASPSRWTVTFQVADCDAWFAAAQSRGAEVLLEPFDAGPMRMAVVNDPIGAQCNVSSRVGSA